MSNRRLRRQLQRLARERGDNCMACGRSFANHDTCLTGYDVAGALVIPRRVLCRAAPGLGWFGVSMYLDSASTARMVASGVPISTGTAWGEDNRAWFVAHPERSRRLRAFAG